MCASEPIILENHHDELVQSTRLVHSLAYRMRSVNAGKKDYTAVYLP